MQKKKKATKEVGAPFRNKNGAGKRVERERIPVNMSVSKKNGLLDLFSQYLALQGIDSTDDNIKELASQWAYHYWGERLKREIEMIDQAMVF